MIYHQTEAHRESLTEKDLSDLDRMKDILKEAFDSPVLGLLSLSREQPN